MSNIKKFCMLKSSLFGQKNVWPHIVYSIYQSLTNGERAKRLRRRPSNRVESNIKVKKKKRKKKTERSKEGIKILKKEKKKTNELGKQKQQKKDKEHDVLFLSTVWIGKTEKNPHSLSLHDDSHTASLSHVCNEEFLRLPIAESQTKAKGTTTTRAGWTAKAYEGENRRDDDTTAGQASNQTQKQKQTQTQTQT